MHHITHTEQGRQGERESEGECERGKKRKGAVPFGHRLIHIHSQNHTHPHSHKQTQTSAALTSAQDNMPQLDSSLGIWNTFVGVTVD